MTRRITAVLVAMGLIAALAGTAAAGHLTSNVKSYTGCLASGDGVIVKVKEGDSPASRCAGGQIEVHLSSGDVTGVLTPTGSGLQGGGTNGSISLSIATGFKLPQGCANDDIPKWNGTSWTCGQDANSTYTAGTGLDLTAGGEFSIESGYRLPTTAAAGDSIVSNGSGTWTTEQFTKAGEACATGQFVRATSSSGGLTCAAPTGGGVTYVSTSVAGVGIPDDGADHQIAALTPGAGTYFVIVKGKLTSQLNVDDFSAVGCELRMDGTVIDEFRFGSTLTDSVTEIPFALTAAAPVTSGFSLSCYADDGADGMGVEDVKLIGLKITA